LGHGFVFVAGSNALDELGEGVVIFTVVLRSGAGLVADKELAYV
jgi:hypothetical protein